jgi:hypothetical protein
MKGWDMSADKWINVDDLVGARTLPRLIGIQISGVTEDVEWYILEYPLFNGM